MVHHEASMSGGEGGVETEVILRRPTKHKRELLLYAAPAARHNGYAIEAHSCSHAGAGVGWRRGKSSFGLVQELSLVLRPQVCEKNGRAVKEQVDRDVGADGNEHDCDEHTIFVAVMATLSSDATPIGSEDINQTTEDILRYCPPKGVTAYYGSSCRHLM